MDSIPCDACGCTEYTKHLGFYICNNCDTQSQKIEVQYFDATDFCVVADEERDEVRSEKSVGERALTSWECWNILLTKLVDELIDLGASKKIRVLAFQLWASYLQWAKVAFTSKSEEKIPALSLGFKEIDVDILYGVPKLKQKLFKTLRVRSKQPRKRQIDDCASESTVVSSSRHMRLKQRKKSLNETMNKSDYEIPVIETLESLDKERESQKPPKQNIVFKSSARSAVKEIVGPRRAPTKNLVRLRKQTKERRLKLHNVVYDKNRKRSSQRGANGPLTTITLISIVRLALQLANDEIFLADILRWICEGRFSINQPEKCVPSFSTLVQKYNLLFASRKGFQIEIRNLSHNLNLPNLPTPNLFKLAERYCTELCVPNDFLKLVLKLMVASKVEMNYEKYKFRIFPDYECRVMAFILFVFKLVFSLDDFTEFHQSAFADAVNELQQSQSTPEIPKLFSWNSWKKFMECRKSVLSNYNAPINELARFGQYCEEDVFLNHWENVKPTLEVTKRKINDALMSSLRQEIVSLSSENMQHSDAKKVVFNPGSVTPWNTLTEHILKEYSSSLPNRTKIILSENFTTYSIKHAVDLNWCSDIAQNLKMKVELCNLDDDQLDVKIYDRSINPFPPVTWKNQMSYHDSVPVIIQSKEPPPRRENKDKLFQFKGSVLENDSTSAGQCQKNDLKIYKVPYWYFHDCSQLAIEDFDELATKTFPKSFVWLLGECAAMLRCDGLELYNELILVECVLHRFYDKPRMRKTMRQVSCKMHEW